MSQNKEDIKNKIIYRSSYRGTKEMDILMTNFVKSIINELDYNELIHLDKFINLDDEILKSLKNKELRHQIDKDLINILQKFEKF